MSDGGISIDRPIALVGMMGAGKSTVGRRLASRLGVALIDTDKEIERAAGLSVGELFDRFGEAHFRALERDLVAILELSKGLVLATGGGMFVDPEMRKLLLRQCHTVWLDSPIEQLAERAGQTGERPLLRGSSAIQILARIADQRRDAYALAHVQIKSGDAGPDETADRILRALKAW
ncbi:MAG: shikimate kinase [Allosphingosinicella sp.]